jgi:predicted permease
LTDFINLFAANILPILLIATLGFALQRRFDTDLQPLSKIIFYAFTPAFVFTLLVSSELDMDDFLRMALFAGLLIGSLGLLSGLLSRLLRLDAPVTSVFILTASFMNSGNYGLSLTNFAFGEDGLSWASVFFITSAMLNNSVGAYIAAAGRLNPKEAFLKMARIPALYAICAAALIRGLNWDIPQAIERPLELLGSAAIPSMLILLGMQMASAGLPKRTGLVAAVTGLRLFLSPLLAWFLAPIIGLTGVAAKAGILEAAMPAAVFTTVLSIEFGVEPDFATSVVLATTILSPITITPLLSILGA